MKKILLLLLALITTFASYAEIKQTTIDGVSYRYDTLAGTASVSKRLDGKGYEGKVCVPEQINVGGKTYNVTSLEGYPFAQTKVSSLSLPSCVKVDNLSSDEFKGCSALKYISLHDTDATKLPKGLFRDAEALKELYLGSKNYVTYEPGTFNSITMSKGKSVNVILSYKAYFYIGAPSDCFKEKNEFNITWASKIDGLWLNFEPGSSRCGIHRSLDADYQIKTLDFSKHMDYYIIIDNQLVTCNIYYVEEDAFRDNTTLEHVSTSYLYPREIAQYAFYGCSSLKTVLLYTQPYVEKSSFGKNDPDFRICVEEDKIERYKQDTDHGWSNYADYIGRYEVDATVDNLTYHVYPLENKCTFTGIESGYKGTKLSFPRTTFPDIDGRQYNLHIKRIEDYAGYRNSTTIKEIDLSTSYYLGTIGKYAFRGASNLETLRLPYFIRYIDEGAFTANAGTPLPLKDIYCSSPEPCDINEYAFTYGATLHVPSPDAVKAYKAHPVWGKFSNIVYEGLESYGISIMGIEVNSLNCTDILDDGRVSYVPSTGELTFQPGYYGCVGSIIDIHKKMTISISAEGAIFDCTSDDPAINVDATATVNLLTGLTIYHNAVGIRAASQKGCILNLQCSSTLYINGRSEDMNRPILGFAQVNYPGLYIRTPYNATYDPTRTAFAYKGTMYNGDLEVGNTPGDGPLSYGISVLGVKVTEDNYADVLGDGRVEYMPTAHTISFAAGTYGSEKSFLEVDETVERLTIRHKDNGRVIYYSSETVPAISVKGDANIMFMGIKLLLWCMKDGIVAENDSRAYIGFYDGSEVKIAAFGNDIELNPISGFATFRLSNRALAKPFFGIYDSNERCLLFNGKPYHDTVEIGAIDDSERLPIYVLGKSVPAYMKDDILNDGTLSYDDGILTLNNAKLMSKSTTLIASNEELTIRLVGSNTLLCYDAVHPCLRAPGINIEGNGVDNSILLAYCLGDGEVSAEASAILSLDGVMSDVNISNCYIDSYSTSGLFGIGCMSSNSLLTVSNSFIASQGAWGSVGGFGSIDLLNCNLADKDSHDISGDVEYNSVYCDVTGKDVNTYQMDGENVRCIHIEFYNTDLPYWAVTDRSEVGVEDNLVELIWDPASDNDTSIIELVYTIIYEEVDGEDAGEFTTKPGETSAQLLLKPFTTYTYVIIAYDQNGNSSRNVLEGTFTTYDDVDGISLTPAASLKDSQMYDLMGRKLSRKPASGLYIQNGRVMKQ